MPIALRKDVVYAALDYLAEGDLQHYDVRCPRCRKTNRISRESLLHAAPNWEREREKSESAEE
jgi:phage FluMu protein Com